MAANDTVSIRDNLVGAAPPEEELPIEGEVDQGGEAAQEDSGEVPEMTPAEIEQAQFVTELLLNMLTNPDVAKAVQQVTRAADPVFALAQFVVQISFKIDEALDAAGIETPDNIWLAEGGVIDEVIKASILVANIPGQVLAEEQATMVFDESIEAMKAIFQGVQANAQQKATSGQQLVQPGIPQAAGPQVPALLQQGAV